MTAVTRTGGTQSRVLYGLKRKSLHQSPVSKSLKSLIPLAPKLKMFVFQIGRSQSNRCARSPDCPVECFSGARIGIAFALLDRYGKDCIKDGGSTRYQAGAEFDCVLVVSRGNYLVEFSSIVAFKSWPIVAGVLFVAWTDHNARKCPLGSATFFSDWHAHTCC